MGQVIPFRRNGRLPFTDDELEQLWETYAAARRAEAALKTSPRASDADLADASQIVELTHRLFAESYQRAYAQ